MPKTPLEIEMEEHGVSGSDLAKALAVKVAATVVTVVGIGIVTHVIEKQLGKDKG